MRSIPHTLNGFELVTFFTFSVSFRNAMATLQMQAAGLALGAVASLVAALCASA